MDRTTLDSKNKKIVGQRNVFLFFSVISSFAVVLLTCLLFLKRERVVILPTSGPSLWIEEGRVSDVYLERFGSYIADLLLTRTPADVDFKNKILMEHIHPHFYHEARKLLQQDKESIVNSDQVILFRPFKSYIDLQKQAYIVEGELSVFVGKTGEIPSCAQSDKKKFTFGFDCQGGKLLLKSLKREVF